MRSRLLRHFSTLLLVLLGSSCSSATDERETIKSTPEDYCQNACQKAHACNDATDASECRSSCQTELGAKPQLRADFLAYVASCVDNRACSAASVGKCKNEAQAQLSASNYGQSFCTAFVEAGNRCEDSGASDPQTDCLAAAKSYDDSALKAANDCLGQSCAALSACLAQAIPDVTLYP